MKKEFIKEVRDFMRANKIAPTTFGLESMNDKGFVADLFGGRDVKVSTMEKVRRYMRKRSRISA